MHASVCGTRDPWGMCGRTGHFSFFLETRFLLPLVGEAQLRVGGCRVHLKGFCRSRHSTGRRHGRQGTQVSQGAGRLSSGAPTPTVQGLHSLPELSFHSLPSGVGPGRSGDISVGRCGLRVLANCRFDDALIGTGCSPSL